MSSKPQPRPRNKQSKEPQLIRVWHNAGDKITVLKTTSRSRELPHTVDLEAYRLNGECDCENFTFTEAKYARADRNKPNSQRKPHRCAHIKAAREWLLNKFLKQIMDPHNRSRSPYNSHE